MLAMEKCVKTSSIRSRHPHPAMKWSLLVGFVAVLVLGIPHKVAASSPSVMAPAGPSTGGYFTGTYTFDIYISCQSGLSYSTSYSNSLEGTHTFSFDGAADGSLMLRIDGGGDLIIYSCGDPTPSYLVSSYTVSRDTTSPSVGINSPADGATTSASSVAVAVAAGDATSGVGQVRVNGVAASFSAGVWNATIGLNVGSNTVVAIAQDRAGNTASASISVNRSAPSGGGGPPASPPPSGGVQATPTPYVAPYRGTTSTQTPPPDPTPTPAPTPSAEASSTPVTVARASSTPTPSHTPPVSATSTKPGPILNAKWVAWMKGFGYLAVSISILYVIFGVRRVRRSLFYRFNSIRLRLNPYLFRLRLFIRGKEHDIQRSGIWSHKKHTGKIVAHHHTNYPALVFLMLCTTVFSASYAYSGRAATSDSTLSLTVLGPAPTVGASINSPTTGASVSNPLLQVSGGCPVGLAVELYRNGGFAGSTYCDASGAYIITLTLVEGSNTLIARDVDGLGQYGPDSNNVTVTYTVPPPSPSPSPTPSPSMSPSKSPSAVAGPRRSTPQKTNIPVATNVQPFTIDTDQHYYQGVNPGDNVTWHLKIIGGTPPFEVLWSWGDGTSDKISTTDRQSSSTAHQYKSPGFYKVTVTVTDQSGRKSLIQLLVVVNGAGSFATTTSPHEFGNLFPIWPVLAGTMLLTISFWLGEIYFKGKGDRFAPVPTSTAAA